MSFASFRHPESIGEVNEFQSVLHTTPGGPTIAAHSHDGGLTGQQLYDRIETQLELLDKKRLQLQQLLRSWHQTPYSSRLARNVEASRVESAKLAKKVHHLFKFIPTIEAEAKASATSSSFSSSTELDPSIQLKFQPLFQNYAAVSRILNLVCLESIEFEKEIEEKGLNKTNGSTSGSTPTRRRLSSTSDSPSSTVPNSVRRKQLNAEPVPNDFRLDSDSPTLHLQQQVLDDSLPALEVNGLDAYEASKKRGEFMNLQSMVLDVATSFQTLNQLSAQQQQFVDMSESNINATQLKTLKAENELRQASRYKAYGLVLAGGVTGAAIAGPIGALVGLKTGLSVGVGIGLLGAGGALLGAAAGKQIQKARFVPVTHEEEEQEMQLLEKDKNQPAATTASSSTSSSSSSSVTTSPDKGRACSRKCM